VVIFGMVPHASTPRAAVAVKIEGGRIRIPPVLVARLPRLSGREALNVWLLVIHPGRCRVVFQEQASSSEVLRRLIEKLQGPGPDEPITDPSDAESSEHAALAARLIPTTVSPKGPGWRLLLPRSLPGEIEPIRAESIWLLLSQGYLEIWDGRRLAACVEGSLADLVPGDEP